MALAEQHRGVGVRVRVVAAAVDQSTAGWRGVSGLGFGRGAMGKNAGCQPLVLQQDAAAVQRAGGRTHASTRTGPMHATVRESMCACMALSTMQCVCVGGDQATACMHACAHPSNQKCLHGSMRDAVRAPWRWRGGRGRRPQTSAAPAARPRPCCTGRAGWAAESPRAARPAPAAAAEVAPPRGRVRGGTGGRGGGRGREVHGQ